MTRSYKTEGIVIKRYDVHEADRIITLFSRHLGKMQIKAVGIRRIASRRSAHVELFNQAVFSLYRGKSLPILTEAESLKSFRGIKNDLSKIAAAYHICELIDSLCAYNQENQEVFIILEQALNNLESKDNPSVVVRQFEEQLLSALGFLSLLQAKTVFNTQIFIENLIERKLKSKYILSYTV